MLATDKGVVEEWLSEFKTLPETSISSYASSLKGKSTLVSELYTVICEPHCELLEPVCHQLFEFYRSAEVELKRFTLQYLPELVWSYLSVITRDMHSSGCIEALLLGIYNLEIADKDGCSKVQTFTIPSLSKPSVYHEKEYTDVDSRIPVSAEFMVHMLTAIYYAMYNGEWDLACKALDDLLYRAQLEMFAEPLLVGNAIKNMLPFGALKSSKDAPRSIEVEITPTSSRISRNAVTSLSIRGHRWKRNDVSSNHTDSVETHKLPLSDSNVTNVQEDKHDNGERSKIQTENDVQHYQAKELTDLQAQEDLMDISEVDEGFCSKASNTSNKTSAGKSQLKSSSSKPYRDKEMVDETCREHSARKQSRRAVSENLELLAMKRLTLTSSQSLPKPGSHNHLASTATTHFSKSFEHVSGVFIGSSPAGVTGRNLEESNRFSACSLQDDRLALVPD
ncbi:hypothetical protein chiPu_0017753 [Chiloscyllium punctatum]|uniref:Hyccin n=1 Tax=Chiloscyllium punctatum TaxID=137246 RepID=A0A401RIQ5_CHIPU|nr:hypothetical protein [Chiloscyllium punctatum]